ncbi:MAG: AAA family ATPase [Synechococcaceae cyanobacterium ELA445]
MNYDDEGAHTSADLQPELSGNLSEGSPAEADGSTSVQPAHLQDLIPTPADQAGGPALGTVQELPAADGSESTEPPAEEGQLPDATQSNPADTPGTPLIKSTAEALAEFEEFVTDLCVGNSPHPKVHARKKAKQLQLPLTKDELEQIFRDAEERESAHQLQPHKAGETVNVTPTNWLVLGILIAGVLNILVGPGKVGKTALLVGLLGALTRGETSFLGLPLTGPCPPVLLVGTDQPLSVWHAMLGGIGLMVEQPDGTVLIREPISEFYHSKHPVYLNQTGIAAIADWCACHPGGLVILDSASSLTLGLNISENSREFAIPFANLQKAIAPFGATTVVIHHTNKATKGFDPTQASRGSSALPAQASQLVGLFHHPTPRGAPPDSRIVLAAKGRGGPPIELVIERGEGTNWISHGTLEEVQAEEQQRSVSLNLNDRQALVLEILEKQQGDSGDLQTTALIKPHLPADFIDPEGRLLRRTLEQLEAKGLLEVQKVTTATGIENRYGSKTVLRQLEFGDLTDQEDDKPDSNGVVPPTRPPAVPTPAVGESHAAAPAVVPDPPAGLGSSEVLAVNPIDAGHAGPGNFTSIRTAATEVANEPEEVIVDQSNENTH